jgi:hypothetical protein
MHRKMVTFERNDGEYYRERNRKYKGVEGLTKEWLSMQNCKNIRKLKEETDSKGYYPEKRLRRK